MSSKFEYPERCPVAADLREALSDGIEDMEIEEVKVLLIYAAETLERQHEYLKFIHTSMKGTATPGMRKTGMPTVLTASVIPKDKS